MSAPLRPHLTPDEYLAIDRAAEIKSEYYDGRMYAMSGGSVRHGTIIPNLYRELVRVSPRGLYTFPDAMVVAEGFRRPTTTTTHRRRKHSEWVLHSLAWIRDVSLKVSTARSISRKFIGMSRSIPR